MIIVQESEILQTFLVILIREKQEPVFQYFAMQYYQKVAKD